MFLFFKFICFFFTFIFFILQVCFFFTFIFLFFKFICYIIYVYLFPFFKFICFYYLNLFVSVSHTYRYLSICLWRWICLPVYLFINNLSTEYFAYSLLIHSVEAFFFSVYLSIYLFNCNRDEFAYQFPCLFTTYLFSLFL